jgi:septin family protein
MTRRNILLLGKMGSGKSTLANVLVNKNDCFDEVFQRGSGSFSKTQDIQSEQFSLNVGEWLEFNYQVIDTPGLGDNRFDERTVLNKIAELSKFANEGFYQIFFVVKERFNNEDIGIFNSLKDIFDEKINEYITIVRTGFEDFCEFEECEKDRKELMEINQETKKIVESCNGIVYINNPSPKVYKEKGKELYRESRKRLLSHLSQLYTNYKPKELAQLNEKVNEYLEEKEEIQKQLEELKELSKLRKIREKELKERERKIAELDAKIEEQTKNSSYWKLQRVPNAVFRWLWIGAKRSE